MLYKLTLAMLFSVLGASLAGAQVQSSHKIDDGPSGGLPADTLQDTHLFGGSVTLIDVDGDGTQELAVGAEQDAGGGSFLGAVWILSLDENGRVTGTPRKITDGTEGFPAGSLDHRGIFGSSVAPIDVDGDGKQELVVGAKNLRSQEPGAVWILWLDENGKVTGTPRKITNGTEGFPADGLQAGDLFGSAVTPIDVDGDGRQELAVGAPGDGAEDQGAVWILSLDQSGRVVGTPQKILAEDAELVGDDNYLFGSSMATIDVDGDGRQELAVGVPREVNTRGAVRILFLDREGLVNRVVRIAGEGGEGFLAKLDGNAGFGRSVAPIDVDGNGVDELVVGAAGGELNRTYGDLYVLFLDKNGTVKRHQKIGDGIGGFPADSLRGDNVFDAFGWSIMPVDVDRDSIPEFVVGAPGNGEEDQGKGALWVLFRAAPFSKIQVSLPELEDGSGAWGDFDNDGDLDLVLTGEGGSEIYRNEGADDASGRRFTAIGAGLTGAADGSGAWGDFDNDGDLDLVLTGESSAGVISEIYRNGDSDGGGTGSFSKALDLPGIKDGSAAWGDFDNDGDLDLLLTGNTDSGPAAMVYENYGNAANSSEIGGQFVDIGARLTAAVGGTAAWGDYDNDDDLDLVLVGDGRSEIYRNNAGNRNTTPASPEPDASKFMISPERVTLGWILSTTGSRPDDNGDFRRETFTYNLRIGTAPGASDILTPMAESASTRRLAALGNTGHAASWTIRGLEDSTYYWSVQAVDQTFAGSAFAQEQMFTLARPPAPTGLQAEASNASVTLHWAPVAEAARYDIYRRLEGDQALKLRAMVQDTTSFIDDSATNDISNMYRITAVTAEGVPSNFSDVVLARPSQRPIFANDPKNFPPLPEFNPENPTSTTAVRIDSEIDDNDLASVEIHYRPAGRRTFTLGQMTDMGDNNYEFVIPADSLTDRGIEYFIFVRDLSDNEARSPTDGIFSIQVRVQEPGIKKSDAQPAGSEQTAYRLISAPIRLDLNNPGAVFNNELEEYDMTRWRLFGLKPDQAFSEFPLTSNLEPGKALLLIVRDPNIRIDTGAGVTVSTSNVFEIELDPRWNFIGNPYNYPIPLGNVTFGGQAVPEGYILTYDGAWISPPSGSLLPFEGYAVFYDPAIAPIDTLTIDPYLAPASASAAKKTTAATDDLAWSIRILARSQQARDTDNLAAVASNASDTWDGLDRPEPPGIGDYVSVYFSHPEWKKLTARYSTDTRPVPTDGAVWPFDVTTTVRDKVHLSFEGLAEVPPEFDVWLVDDIVQTAQNLRETPTYAVAGTRAPRPLKLVVGRPGFLEGELRESQEIPTRFELFPNFPNPFNPTTTIRYGLPTTERVSLVIYNVLGEKVATLEAGAQKEAGYHAVVWDGRSDAGTPVASGVYFAQMRAERFVQTQKMVLVK